MEKLEKKKKKFGLVGKNISYSFSESYFTEKFKDLGLNDHSYSNFDLESIEDFPSLLTHKYLSGLNVTIPYKELVIPYLTKLDAEAAKIGAVNTIKFTQQGPIGYNTDAFGFKTSLTPLLGKHHQNALILGTGGASKAIAYVLTSLGINFKYVSRKANDQQLTYEDLDKKIFDNFSIIINCTPLGTHPHIYDKPAIPYEFITKEHILFDLIYNPLKTAFLKAGEERSAIIQNGLPMLRFQAEKSWEIWNS